MSDLSHRPSQEPDGFDSTLAQDLPVIELVSSTGAGQLAVLVHRCAAADATALSELYDVTAPRVYGLALRILGSTQEAEDVASGTYLEVWRTSTSFDVDRGSADAWIAAIAHRRAVDRLRLVRTARLGSRGATRRRDVRPRLRDAPADPDRSGIEQALADLTSEQRELLELAYFDGYVPRVPERLTAILTELVTARLQSEDGTPEP